MKYGTLILNVVHGKELEIEYEKKNIIDKINSFFGYNCINNIKLRTVHEQLNINKKNFPKIKNFSKIEKKMKTINDEPLKSSLSNLIKAFNEKNK